MTAPSIREAVARAICCEMSRQPRTDTRPEKPGVCYCKPEEMADLCPENFRHADAALAVALPIIREHYAAIAESYEPRCDVCPRGVSTAIRADEGPR